mgnify:CR=1 FL=1
MSAIDILHSPEVERLFQAILSLENGEECEAFLQDLCTIKELRDMSQRLKAAQMLLSGFTYDQIQKEVEISTATISRVNRCIQYGPGGYEKQLLKIGALPPREEKQ